MVFINVYNGNNCIAEICGNVEIKNRLVAISVRQEDIIPAFKIVAALDESTFMNWKLLLPAYCVKYMSNRHDFTKEGIRLINFEPADPNEPEGQEEEYENQ